LDFEKSEGNEFTCSDLFNLVAVDTSDSYYVKLLNEYIEYQKQANVCASQLTTIETQIALKEPKSKNLQKEIDNITNKLKKPLNQQFYSRYS
jgi:hypothetical protein